MAAGLPIRGQLTGDPQEAPCLVRVWCLGHEQLHIDLRQGAGARPVQLPENITDELLGHDLSLWHVHERGTADEPLRG